MKQQSHSRELKALISIAMLMGLSWLFGAFVSTGDSTTSLIFQYLFAIFVTLQGFAIFLLQCIFHDTVRDAILGRKRVHTSSGKPMTSSNVQQAGRLPGTANTHMSSYPTLQSMTSGSNISQSRDATLLPVDRTSGGIVVGSGDAATMTMRPMGRPPSAYDTSPSTSAFGGLTDDPSTTYHTTNLDSISGFIVNEAGLGNDALRSDHAAADQENPFELRAQSNTNTLPMIPSFDA